MYAFCDYNVRESKTLKLNPKEYKGQQGAACGYTVVTEFSHSHLKSLLSKFHNVL